MTKIMKRKEESLLSKKDLEFYKKRIFKLTKDMLRGEKVNTKVNKARGAFLLTQRARNPIL